jgi:hypothetical protein
MSYKLVLKTILFSILTTLSQIGCTIYYSTDSLNGKLKTNIDKVNNNCISVTDKINEMHKQYLSLNCKTDTKPFQTAKEQLEKTEKLVNEMLVLQQNLNNEYSNFISYSKGKDKIESGTPEWKKFKVTKKKMKSDVSELQSVGNKAVKNATSFNKHVNESIVPIVQFCDVSMYNTKFNEIITSLNKNENDLSDNLKNYESQVINLTDQFNNVFPDKCNEIKTDLNKLNSGKTEFQNIKLSVQNTINEFKQKTTGKQKIYSCSSDWTIVTDTESKVASQQLELNGLQQKIQSIINHIQEVGNSMK